jgi:hypothetical protein
VFGWAGLLFMLMTQLSAETTQNRKLVLFQDANGQWRYTYQSRANPAARVEEVVTSRGEVVAQVRGTYYRGPSDGTRTRTIEGFGGVAAQQICGGPLEITNPSGQCRELEYDRDFLEVMQTDGLACLREATQDAFGFRPTQVRLRTGEGQVSRTRYSANGKLSTHALGRAIDIFSAELYRGSSRTVVSMSGSHRDRPGHRTFYSEFYECWEDVVDQAQAAGIAGSCGSGNLGYNDDRDHWGHLHTSLPPSRQVRRQHGANCT